MIYIPHLTSKNVKELEEKGKTELNISDFDFITIEKRTSGDYRLVINGKVVILKFFYELSGAIETFIKTNYPDRRNNGK